MKTQTKGSYNGFVAFWKVLYLVEEKVKTITYQGETWVRNNIKQWLNLPFRLSGLTHKQRISITSDNVIYCKSIP